MNIYRQDAAHAGIVFTQRPIFFLVLLHAGGALIPITFHLNRFTIVGLRHLNLKNWEFYQYNCPYVCLFVTLLQFTVSVT